MGIEKRTVLITGASSGIGLGLAKAWVERGANVVLNARNEANLRQAAGGLGHGDRVALVPGNIGDRTVGRRMVDVAQDRFGGVDVLINNAGHFDAKPFEEYSEEDLDGFFTAHVKGNFLTSQAVTSRMRTGGGGVIINITTVLAQRASSAIPSSAPIAAKSGVEGMTRSLAIELAPDNIRVNAVAPGIIRTPIHGRTDAQLDELNGMQPLGRLGEVADVVEAVLYLADADFVTGVVLPVDGGIHAGA